MFGKRHVFVVRGLLGPKVGKRESRRCDLAIHMESGRFTKCRFCGTKGGGRQISHHDGGVVASDDSPRVSRKGYAAKIHAGIDKRQQGRSVIVRNGAAADKRLRVSIDADASAGGVGAAAIVLNLICAEEPCLAVAVEIDSGAGVTGNLDVRQGDLATETGGNAYRPIGTNGSLRREDGNSGALTRSNSTGFISLHEVRPVVGGAFITSTELEVEPLDLSEHILQVKELLSLRK